MKTIKHHLTTLLLAGIIGLGWPALAAKAAPSPFAGTWCDSDPHGLNISGLVISSSGKISGSVENVFYKEEYSGSISSDGMLKLVVTTTSRGKTSFDGYNPRGTIRTRTVCTGIVALDEQGNIVGVIQIGDWDPVVILWERCS
ncbi:MAG: hypothetical protein KIS67_04155 [Verrucomicrobiae bacterium]|nr:hypothetical protein [Verrucomicrobiae bacterium]